MGEFNDPCWEINIEDTMTHKQPIKAVIFDFDGTLADTRRPIMQCFWEVLNDLDIPLPPSLTVNEFFCQTLGDSLRSIDNISADQISDASAHYDNRYLEIAVRTAKLYPEVTTTLQLLRKSGLLIGIATNESRKNLKTLTEKLKINTLIHQCVCHDEVRKTKPFPDMAKQISEAIEKWVLADIEKYKDQEA